MEDDRLKTKPEIQKHLTDMEGQIGHKRSDECACCNWMYSWCDALRWVLAEGENKEITHFVDAEKPDKEFLLNIRGFVKAVYDYRPPMDVEAENMPYNTCDYYAMELLLEQIDKKIKEGDVNEK
jgi:hypothetical protein